MDISHINKPMFRIHTLLFEDATACVLGEMLETKGCCVSHFSGSPGFLQEMAGAPPDLIIISAEDSAADIAGFVAEIKNHSSLNCIPILAALVPDDSRRIQSCYDVGFDDYISIPFVGFEVCRRCASAISSGSRGINSSNGLQLGFNAYSECDMIINELQKHGSRMSMFIDESPYPLAIHIEGGEIIKLSKSWSEISGYDINEIPTIQLWTRKTQGVSEERTNWVLSRIYDIDRRVYEGEFVLKTRSGEERVWDFSSSPLGKLSDGRRIIMSMAVDVTERKALARELNRHRNNLEEMIKERTIDLERSRKAALSLMQDATLQKQKTEELIVQLRESNRQIENLKKQIEFILGATRTGLDIIDQDFNMHYINSEWEKIYGSYGGRKCYEYFFDAKEPCEHCGMAAAFETGLVTIWELCLTREKNRPVQVTSIPYTDKDGKMYVAEVKADIAERKRMERELIKAKEASDMANKAKSAFLANMSHEIRTPMHAILGYTQLLMRNPDLELTQKKYLEIISRSGNHLLALLNSVLEMSKIEAGKITIHKANFSFIELLRDIEMMFGVQAQTKGLKFTIDEENVYPHEIRTDREKVRQVLNNLLSNAMKFTESGSIVVKVHHKDSISLTDADDSPMLNFCVEVIDTGCGIAPEEIDKVFVPFEQTQSGINLNMGTGLGMSISRQYARLLGGDLKVSSVPGEGTVFTFEFEAQEVDSSHKGYAEPDFPGIYHIAPGERDWRVLVVDDDETNRYMLGKMLVHAGFQVVEACNGYHALNVFALEKPDIILMDIKMQGLDGFETARKIRQSFNSSEIKIIAVSASILNERFKRQSGACMDGYILKPFREEEVIKKIQVLTGIKFVRLNDMAEQVKTNVVQHQDLQAAIEKLPEEIRQRFVESLEFGDISSMQEVINEIGEIDESLSDILGNFVSKFDYTGLARLFGIQLDDVIV